VSVRLFSSSFPVLITDPEVVEPVRCVDPDMTSFDAARQQQQQHEEQPHCWGGVQCTRDVRSDQLDYGLLHRGRPFH